MKTKSLWIAIAALAMTGCSQNEIMEMSPDANPAVGFGIFTGTQTKGTVTNNEATGTGVRAVGFGVLAAYTGQDDWTTSTEPNFMYNQQVTWSSTAWTYSPLKYWPKASGDKISFWAYAPYDGNNSKGIALSASNAKAAPNITFEVNTDPTKMVDLVAGCAMNQTKPGDATVSFDLEHVLSKVVFHAKVSDELFSNADAAKKTHIFITKAELLGDEVFTKAVYNFSTNASANDTWDYTGATKATPTAMDITNVLNLKTDNNIGKTTPYTTKAVDLTTTTASSIFKDNQFLFLIPAATNGISGTGKAQVKFTYDIVTVDDNLAIGYSKTTSTVTADLTTSTLKKGVAYKYTFTFGVDAIKVSADVSVWGSDTEQPITPNL